MKKFFKKANRGLLLGGIVLVGFIAFVITDTISFKKNKPVIEDEIKSYVNSLESIAVTKDLSSNLLEKNINELISEYWTFSNEKNESYYYGVNQNEFKNNLEDITSEQEDGVWVSKWTAKVGEVSISKAGPGFAQVSFDCQIVAEFSGNAYLLTPCDAMTMDCYAYYGESVPSTLSRISVDGTYEATMTQKDGKWKICCVDAYGWNSSEITAVDEQEGGNEE
ncbi:hypothetical protein [Porcipelethomonas sp.]|uniref:hypothetical protein n=1 Tax=Porcipelethomonas sp. TaxID=2981675 RepID=UPI003EF117BC